ncbi:hypothetical protein ACWGCP_13285 [Streptomyces niveus]
MPTGDVPGMVREKMIVVTYAAVKAAPHVRQGLANLKSKLNRGEPVAVRLLTRFS